MSARGSWSGADRRCLVAFAALDGVGPATVDQLRCSGDVARSWALLVEGSARAVPALAELAERAREHGLLERLRQEAAARDPDGYAEAHRAAGISVAVAGEPSFPAVLVGDPSPIPLLFARGDLELLGGPAVAIVGTRNATRLGCETAGDLAVALARCGVAVVSGLALGIDGAVHRRLLEVVGGVAGAGRPVGVVAAGLDLAYPRRHRGLHGEVASSGVLLGETPMGVPPARWRFPARNRLIAALSDAVVVVESRSAGGSMLTAGEALVRDVPVLAVPGHPASPAAAGPLDLIAEGALPVRDVDDVLVAIGRGGARPLVDGSEPNAGGRPVSDAGRTVLDALAARPRTMAQLVAALDVPFDVVATALVELEADGHLVRSGGWFELAGSASLEGGPR